MPKLTEKYLMEIGTIFFDEETISWFGQKEGKFTKKIFLDFGRFPNGGCYAIRKTVYIKVGGYQREFSSRDKKKNLTDRHGVSCLDYLDLVGK